LPPDLADLTPLERIAAAAKYYDETKYSADGATEKSVRGESLTEIPKTWLLDAGRAANDVTILSDAAEYIPGIGNVAAAPVPEAPEDGEAPEVPEIPAAPAAPTSFTVYVFDNRFANEEPTIDLTVLYVSPQYPDSGDYYGEDGAFDSDGYAAATEEFKAAVKTRAEALYAEWGTAGFTEDALLEIKTTNEASDAETIGSYSYESIARSGTSLSQELSDWYFDSARASGDHTLMADENGNQYLMLFKGFGPMFGDYLADTRLRQERMTEWLATFTEGKTVDLKWGYRFINSQI